MCACSFLIRVSGVSFAKNGIPLLKQPLRQLRDVFRVLDKVANLNSRHVDAIFRLTRHEISDRAKPVRSLIHLTLIAIAIVGAAIACA